MTKTTVLYIVQVSNTTIVDGRTEWYLSSDACFNIAVGLIKCVLDKTTDVQFIVKVPTVIDAGFYPRVFAGYLDRVKFVGEDIPKSPVNSRFNFDFNYWVKCPALKDVDCVINDENTLTCNWRALFQAIGKPEVPIISTNYFLDADDSIRATPEIRYWYRQLESFLLSDIAAFQCIPTYEAACTAARKTLKEFDLRNKWTVWNVGAHYAEIQKVAKAPRNSRFTIYFGNRITETSDRYTNWHIFAEAIGIFAHMQPDADFAARLLNPTGKATPQQVLDVMRLSRGYATVLEKPFSRQEYLNFITQSHVSCNLFTTEVHGGVTSIEAMMAGNITVCPRVNNYEYNIATLGEWDRYPYFCSLDAGQSQPTRPSASSIAGCINKAYEVWASGSGEFEAITARIKNIAYETSSYELAADKVLDSIFAAIANRTGKEWHRGRLDSLRGNA